MISHLPTNCLLSLLVSLRGLMDLHGFTTYPDPHYLRTKIAILAGDQKAVQVS